MNIEQLRTQAIESHRQEMAALDFIEEHDLADEVSQISGNSFFTKDRCFDLNMQLLTRLRRITKLEMGAYHMNGNNLSVRYLSDDLEYDFLIFFNDPEYALSKISGGKCTITEQTHRETTVVCNL